MHELSIAQQIVETVEDVLRKQNETARVSVVYVRVGALSGVIAEALEFAWDIACASTLLDGSRLSVEQVPITVRCDRCNAEHELPGLGPMRCPACDAPTPDVVRGRELDVVSVELDDEEDGHDA